MLNRPHKALILLSALVLLGSVSFADVNHAHFLAADYPIGHRLYHHDCGPAEVHKSITLTFHCVAGCRVFDSFLIPHICLSADQNVRRMLWTYDEARHASRVSFTRFQRGPPVLSV